MKTRVVSMVVCVLILCVTSCSSNKTSKDTKTKKGAEQALYLDTSSLTDPVYYGAINQQAMASLLDSFSFRGKCDFDSIYQAYNLSKTDMAISREAALEALGLRQQIVAARAEAAALTAGSAGAETAELGEDLDDLVKEKLSSNPQMSDIQKEYFLISIIRLGAAIAKEKILMDNVLVYQNRVKTMSKLRQLREAANVLRATEMIVTLPGMIASQLVTLKTYLDIASTNNISVPADVTALI